MTTNDAPTTTATEQVDPLHLVILQAYRGRIQGDDSHGGIDLEFDSLHYATSWARVNQIEDRVFLQDNAGRRGFACTISVTYYPAKAG